MNLRLSWRQIAGIASLIIAVLVNLPLVTLTTRSWWATTPGLPDAGFSLSRLVFHLAFSFFFIELNRVTKSRYGSTKKSHPYQFGPVGWYGVNFLLFLILTGLFVAIVLPWYPERPVLIIGTSYFRGFFVWLTALLIGNFLTVLQKNRDIQLENELLKRQNLQAQLDTLRAQLNPHFLFNSLNALSALIREGGPESQHYLTKLSQVLRYSLQVQHQSLVPFTDEMQFTEAYAFLLTIRFGSNLHIDNQLPAQPPWKIPPMSLQLLIENAVNHNVVSNTRPLMIRLTTDPTDDYIVVSNAYQPKSGPTNGLNSGLANLDSRFRLMTGRSIRILRTTTEFTVHLPIIPVI